MAYFGWGVWSLVSQQLANSALGCIFMWWAVPWRPDFRVSGRHLRDLYGYSLSVTGNDILWFFFQKSGFGRVMLGFMHPLMLAQGRPGLYLIMGLVLAGLTLVGRAVAVRWSPVTIGLSMVLTMFYFCVLTLLEFKRELRTRIGPLLKCFVFPLQSSVLARCRGFGAKLDQQDSRSRGHTRVVRRSGNRYLHFDGTLRET
jgi:hypothetical protein